MRCVSRSARFASPGADTRPPTQTATQSAPADCVRSSPVPRTRGQVRSVMLKHHRGIRNAFDSGPRTRNGRRVSSAATSSFSSKITGTAAELGFRVVVEANAALAASKAAASGYRCILLDLSTPGLKVSDLLAALPPANRPSVIAFGPHVEAARLHQARADGCDLGLPRSKFSATLPAILKQALLS